MSNQFLNVPLSMPDNISIDVPSLKAEPDKPETELYTVGQLQPWKPKLEAQVQDAAARCDPHFEEENASKAVWKAISLELKRADSDVFQQIYDI